jgi:hypothetical protein
LREVPVQVKHFSTGVVIRLSPASQFAPNGSDGGKKVSHLVEGGLFADPFPDYEDGDRPKVGV